MNILRVKYSSDCGPTRRNNPPIPRNILLVEYSSEENILRSTGGEEEYSATNQPTILLVEYLLPIVEYSPRRNISSTKPPAGIVNG